jgi:hypothetical protein
MGTMDEEISGKNAETRRRQTGFHRPGKDSKETEERKMREASKQAELEEKYKVWNKGVTQLKEVGPLRPLIIASGLIKLT